MSRSMLAMSTAAERKRSAIVTLCHGDTWSVENQCYIFSINIGAPNISKLNFHFYSNYYNCSLEAFLIRVA
jgi:hypothetical protein